MLCEFCISIITQTAILYYMAIISGEEPAWINPLISGQLLIISIDNTGPLKHFEKKKKSHFTFSSVSRRKRDKAFFLNYILQQF